MLGLAAYGSSSEDEVHEKKPSAPSQSSHQKKKIVQESPPRTPGTQTQNQTLGLNTPEVAVQPTEELNRPLVGPFIPTEQLDSAGVTPSQSRRSSPFSSTRALIRDMTLPLVPNLDIPPSPPGSPDPVANKKFEHFLSLKKQGVHFNEKLAASSSLRNPSLISKMMEHAGIDGKAQYATSLPTEIWDVSSLPSWAYKEELNKSQQEIRRKLEERRPAQREAIDFVSAGVAAESSSRDGTPASGRSRQSAAERVMAGLRRDTRSPHTAESGRRHELDRRPRRPEHGTGQKRHRSRSPPGRRRRSRSR